MIDRMLVEDTGQLLDARGRSSVTTGADSTHRRF
jgi:hypothetical protein